MLVAVTVRTAVVSSPAESESPASCAGVSVHLPPPLLVPADSVASDGTPVMVIDTVSRVSNGVSLMPSTTVPSSFTDNDVGADRPGATGLTANAMVCVAEFPVTLLVAVTVNVAVVTSPAFKARSLRAAAATVQVCVLRHCS